MPARNEEAHLPELLGALAGQHGVDIRTLRICLLLDACTDGSEAVARALRPDLPYDLIWDCHTGGSPANAGLARRAAMALGVAAARGAADAVLLTTDADSVPSHDWIARNLAALERADVVAGRIRRRQVRHHPAQSRLERYYDRLYAFRRMVDPLPWEVWPAHHYTSGASLAVRCSTYDALGGFAPTACGEDGAFVDAAERDGWRVRRDNDVLVETSGRQDGRAPDGLAAWLRTLERQGAGAARVTHPDDLAWRYRGHALARSDFATGEFDALSGWIGLPLPHLLGVARDSRNALAFATRVVPEAPGGERMVGLAEAEALLARLEDQPQRSVA